MPKVDDPEVIELVEVITEIPEGESSMSKTTGNGIHIFRRLALSVANISGCLFFGVALQQNYRDMGNFFIGVFFSLVCLFNLWVIWSMKGREFIRDKQVREFIRDNWFKVAILVLLALAIYEATGHPSDRGGWKKW